MRRFHNPRFAPEFLERKLNPSGVVPVPVTAEVYVPTDSTDPIVPTNGSDPTPPDGDGTPPQAPPTIPGGPADPA